MWPEQRQAKPFEVLRPISALHSSVFLRRWRVLFSPAAFVVSVSMTQNIDLRTMGPLKRDRAVYTERRTYRLKVFKKKKMTERHSGTSQELRNQVIL